MWLDDHAVAVHRSAPFDPRRGIPNHNLRVWPSLSALSQTRDPWEDAAHAARSRYRLVRGFVLWLPGLDARPPGGHRPAVGLILGTELLAEGRLLVAVDESGHARGHRRRVEQQAR